MGYSPVGNPYATSCTKCGLVCEAILVRFTSDCEILNGERLLPRVTGTLPCTPSLTPRFGVVFGRTVNIKCPDETDGTLGEIMYCVEEGGVAKYAHEVCCSCGGGSSASDLNGTIVGYRCGVAEFNTNLSGDISACCGGGGEPVATECCPDNPTPRTLTVSDGTNSYEIEYDEGGDFWFYQDLGGFPLAGCASMGTISLACVEGTFSDWVLGLADSGGTPLGVFPLAVVCDPFELTFTTGGTACDPVPATITVTL